MALLLLQEKDGTKSSGGSGNHEVPDVASSFSFLTTHNLQHGRQEREH